MVDLEGLKKRIELVDTRLKTAHSVRERESDALKQLWEQIHGRFDEQKGEIAELRTKVYELEDARDNLLGMVEHLLSSVEGGLESMTEETVPHSRQMAGELLSSGEQKDIASPAFDDDQNHSSDDASLDESHAQDELLAAIERSLNVTDDFPDLPGSEELELSTAQDESTTSIPETNVSPVEGQPDYISTADISIKPLSPGIRDLVQRLEGGTLQSLSPEGTEDESAEEDDLSRDLREIEVLRGELMGLRERVSGER